MQVKIENPDLVFEANTSVSSIEVDNDTIKGPYKDGAWQYLVGDFLSEWIRANKFSKSATIWTSFIPSVNFHHQGYSIFMAQFGLTKSFLEDLESMLRAKVGRDYVKLSDSVRPARGTWDSQFHIQDNKVWIPLDAVEWMEKE